VTQAQRESLLGRPLFAFALLCGLFGEAVEVLVLERGGMAPPGWRLRCTLFAVYALAGMLLYVAAFLAGRRRLAIAVVLFGALVTLPWLNFDYLPQLLTLRTIVGNGLAIALLVAAAVVVERWRGLTAIAVLLLALAVNASMLRSTGAPVATEREAGVAAPDVNVVLILLDTLRADHVSAYGYPRPTSPQLDKLAREGVLFEHAITQATYTKPSVASLLTGTFVHRHGVISSRDALGTQQATMAELLRRRGYQTAAFSANPWITPEFRFDRGFDHFESNRAIDVQLTIVYRLLRRGGALLRRRGIAIDLTRELLRLSGETNPSNSRRDEILTASVVTWLAAHGTQPFFLYTHLIGPHDPYDPPATAVQPFRNPSWDGTPARTKPPARVLSIFERALPLDPLARDVMVAQYDGAIRFVDGLVGQITAELERLGVLDRTLVVVTADHGEEFYEHGNWGHGVRLYNEIVRVPLIFRLPGVLTPKRRNDPAMLIDVLPTVLGLTRSPSDDRLEGRNLFAGGEVSAAAFAEYFSVEGGSYASRMILQDGLKLIDTRDDARQQHRVELFDLTTDPQEQRNLLGPAAPAPAPERVEALRAALAKFEQVGPATRAPEIDVGGSTREILRNLGYGTLDRN
jgi:arylsulfatase A-like enzyme